MNIHSPSRNDKKQQLQTNPYQTNKNNNYTSKQINKQQNNTQPATFTTCKITKEQKQVHHR